MRAVILLLGALVLIAVAAVGWMKVERRSPTVEFVNFPKVIGRMAEVNLVARTSGAPGLRRVEVRLVSAGKTYQLFEQEYPATGWLGSGITEQPVHVSADLGALGINEGPAQLQVTAETYAWHVLPERRAPVAEEAVEVDLTPPTVQLLTTQHNLRLGGAGAAVAKFSPDTADARIQVGDYTFPFIRGFFADPSVGVAIFAVPQDLSSAARPEVRVADAVGNSRTVALPRAIRDRTFPERDFKIDDAFLARKVPEILAANGQPPAQDLVQGYLFINRDLRRQSEARVKQLTATSTPHPLWDGAFHRQSNSAPMSSFADRRIYKYGDQTIDRQTHLGFDLASLQRAPVEAAQNGIVVFTGPLGIYGEAVIIDHGLGVFSLYGHLSTIVVTPGQTVKSGEHVGQTGETGLAGGDHLHFSIMVDGTHVDPVEWWDGKWIHDHITPALTMFPPAAPPAPSSQPGGVTNASASAPAETGDAAQ